MSVLGTMRFIKNLYNGNNTEGIKLIAISMGGIIGRYALAFAEENSINHYCSEFISCDSPQRGAVINYDFQHIISILSTKSEISEKTDLFRNSKYSLSSIAAKQMLMNNYISDFPQLKLW